jgi:hypothetical protein
MIEWQHVAHEFEADGGLRDIYVLNTDLSDWQQVLDALRGRTPAPVYTVDSAPAPVPSRVEGAFAEWEHERSPNLQFEVGGMILACHFFATDEIEFDLRPQDVAGMLQLQSILHFMREIGELTSKTVILTPENLKQSPIFRFEPGSRRVEYVPPPVF